MLETEVLIIGAGPVGLMLAIDLGQRGIKTLLIEKNDTNGLLPKMERCNARTMEFFRRLGIVERVRDAGFHRDWPMDVFIVTQLNEAPILQLPYGSVNELKAQIAAVNDGSTSLEPYQLISQYTLEPLLRVIAEQLPTVTIRFAHELISFEQGEAGVLATVRAGGEAAGAQQVIKASYLVGCDGGSGATRKLLGIKYEGKGGLRQMRQALFFCEDLFERIPMGKGRHYHVADNEFSAICMQDSGKHIRMSTLYVEGDDLEAKFRRIVGMPIEFKTIYQGEWTQHLLCAERYRDGRVFIAGDAAHLVIPTGGLGMNTGMGDAMDLGWKLAGTLRGWGGPELLNSYETERRQIGLRNVGASGNAMGGRLGWRQAWQPNVREQSPEGEATRAHIAGIADVEQRKTNEILGTELGYRYINSPLICDEAGEAPDPDNRKYVPTTWPGARLPHVWLSEGTPIHDLIGRGYCLLKFNPDLDTRALQRCFAARGAPLQVLELHDDNARAVYGVDLLLLRPDLHVVWRGNMPPADAQGLTALATGALARAARPASLMPAEAAVETASS
jgi:2-polyprenyl-6-methoxyphenol hydroxylase-like FAD-dependent oxidoreductase